MIAMLLRTLVSVSATHRKLALENLALPQQIVVLQRSVKRPRLKQSDRLFWVLLAKIWDDWANTPTLVKPDTVVRWHRKGFGCTDVAVQFPLGSTQDSRRTAEIVEAFPWDTAPRYLLRDRDGIYGREFTGRVEHMGIKEVKTAPRSPWQSPYMERLIGTLRRDCIDHVVVFNENHLRRLLRDYIAYRHNCRTHLSLVKDAPEPRPVEPPDHGEIVEIPMVGGLHHRYARLAA